MGYSEAITIIDKKYRYVLHWNYNKVVDRKYRQRCDYKTILAVRTVTLSVTNASTFTTITCTKCVKKHEKKKKKKK